MQFLIFCLFVIALICLIQGIRKTSSNRVHDPKQYCAICGWTNEKVQLCQFKQHRKTMVAPLCFDCSIEHDALPVRGGISVDTVHARG